MTYDHSELPVISSSWLNSVTVQFICTLLAFLRIVRWTVHACIMYCWRRLQCIQVRIGKARLGIVSITNELGIFFLTNSPKPASYRFLEIDDEYRLRFKVHHTVRSISMPWFIYLIKYKLSWPICNHFLYDETRRLFVIMYSLSKQ
jgi:hypothetical protein